MDKQKSKLNIIVSVLFKIVTVLLVIVVRRELIRCCGNEINGLNALYVSIVGFLSIAELGVGTAITYCMYQPIGEGNRAQVSALYQLFRKAYRIIGAIIMIVGMVMTPFIQHFAKDYTQLDVDLHITFLLMLVSVGITYGFGEKLALINAHKNNYITTAIDSGGLVLQYVLQIICLRLTESFACYLVCRIVTALAQWIVTTWIARKKYGSILEDKQLLDDKNRKAVVKNVKALFMHKIGGLLVNSADSIVISIFIGIVALGEYTNYTSIQSAMAGIVGLIFSSLTAVFGHLYVEKDRETARKYCECFYLLNFVIGTVFYLGYYAIIDNLVAILFSADLVVEKSVSFVITLNGFIQFMRKNTLVFRDATGSFYHDRWKPLAEGLVNIVLSVFLVRWIGVTGAIVATIITNLVICHIVEPYVLYKNAFHAPVRGYYARNYSLIALFVASLLLLDRFMVNPANQWEQLLINGFISVGISCFFCAIVVLLNRDMCKKMWGAIVER